MGERLRDRYLQNGLSISIVNVIEHINFRLYIGHTLPELQYLEKTTNDGRYINKLDRLFVHQTMYVSKLMCSEEENFSKKI